MFILFKNKTLKYYNLSHNLGGREKGYDLGRLQLWTANLTNQPHNLAAHPFNFSLILIYNDIIKWHNYNSKQIFPAYLVTPIKNCKKASYSPLGDKLIITTGSSFMILDSYTLRTVNQICLPNINLQSSMIGGQLNQLL